ncbi:MAG TPA: class I SAM-dependent methyltransferase [Phycisphaerae bacterium]|nr:class I SAM-dependent methyltransferase [Phycisphaerae bacterium]
MEALERLDPQQHRGLYVVDHYARYCFAAQFVAGRRVLDVACGPGYGSHLLRQAGAREVVGVDVAEEAVETARQRYSAPGITYLQGDAHELGPAVQGPFDAIVSFETVEHLSHPARWIRQARALSHDETVLVFSVPNEADNPPDNPYHLHHYNRESFDAMLSEEFPHRVIVPYYTVLASMIGGFAGRAQGPLRVGRIDAAEVVTDDLRPEGYLAVCRLTPGPLEPHEVLTFSRRSYLDTEENRVWCDNERSAWMRATQEQAEQRTAWRTVADEREQVLVEQERINQWHEQTQRRLEEDIHRLETSILSLKQGQPGAAAAVLARGPVAGPDVDQMTTAQLAAELVQRRHELALIQSSPGYALLTRMKSVMPPDSRRGRLVRRTIRILSRR